MKIVSSSIAFIVLVTFFSGCSQTADKPKPMVKADAISQAFANLPEKNEMTKIIKKGLGSIRLGKYKEATELFNEGLRLEPTNGYLHFLNAFSYHLISQNGDAKMKNLALTGYSTALRFNQSNYLAAYLLGHIYFDKKEYIKAQNQFSYGLLYAPNNPYLLRSLSVASYYSNDLSLSRWAAKKAYEVDPKNLANIKNLMFAQAASGNANSAKNLLNKYKATLKDKKEAQYIKNLKFNYVNRRLDSWRGFYAQRVENLFGLSPQDDEQYNSDSFSDSFDDDLEETQIKQNSSKVTKEDLKSLKMALVDVVIIETEEVRSQSKGINLLEGLQATLGGSISYTNNPGSSYLGSGAKPWSVNPTLDFSGLTYNFNIFNNGENKAEILARPSLLAIEGQTSKFYSGSTLHVALYSDEGDGSVEDIHIGINLAVTPQFYADGVMKIQVHADRSLLVPLDEEVGFKSSSQTTKTSVDATAVLKIGETLILSGLTENTKSDSKSGAPFLEEIPGVQYLFSKRVNAQKKKSILILLTPRHIQYYDNEAYDVKKEVEKNKIYTKKLKKREKVTATNIDVAIAQSANNSLFQEFRSEDLKLDEWNNDDTFISFIERMLAFLYY